MFTSTRSELRTPFGDSVITINEIFNTAELEHVLDVRENSFKNKQDSVGSSSKYTGDLKLRPQVPKKYFHDQNSKHAITAKNISSRNY